MSRHRCAPWWLLAAPLLLPWAHGPASAQSEPKGVVYVTPRPSGPPGAEVSVAGLGFDTGQAVEIRWGGPSGEVLGTAAGPDFTAPVTVPEAEPGLHTLVVLSRDVNAVMGTTSTAAFLVTGGSQAGSGAGPGTSAPTTVPAPTHSAVPEAGPTPPLAWAAVVLVLSASGVVLYRARRRQRRAAVAGAV